MSAAADALLVGVCAGDRRALAKAITLVESERAEDAALRVELIASLPPRAAAKPLGWRLGVTGAPGVGKSSLIERLGLAALEQGERVAVLAVDPSSPESGGSVLGDKTRMTRLGARERAFVRPSPARGAQGGTARRTREAISLCEAAGFELVIVETVGVGQAELAVAELVDSVLLVQMPGAGDGVQALKRGLIELAHAVAINKADGDRRISAERDARELADALGLADSLPGVASEARWSRPVLAVSAQDGFNLPELWQALRNHRATLERSGELAERRAAQQRRWLDAAIDERLRAEFLGHAGVSAEYAQIANEVGSGKLNAERGAERLLDVFRGGGQ